jgi:N-acetyl-beta-hexosaminidase
MSKLRLSFKGAEKLLKGINAVSEDLFFDVADQKSADIAVNAIKSETGELKVTLKDKECTIFYPDKVCFFRGLLILTQAVSEGKEEINICEKPFFETNGMMLDLSRNNSLNEKSLKYFIRQHAVMGLNTVMLYMEDMYEAFI